MTRDWYLSYPKDAQTAIVNVSHPSLCHPTFFSRLSIVKTSFSLLSLLENLEVTFLFATFARRNNK